MVVTSDEKEVRECRNKRCKRVRIPVIRVNSRYCSECGAKLKMWYGASTDEPPLIDAAPEFDTKRRSVNGIVTLRIPEKKMDYFAFKDSFLKDHSGVTVNANVVWDAYKKYEEEFAARHSSASTTPARASRSSDTFTCESDLEGCPLMKSKGDERMVRVPYNMYQKWIWLALRNDTEWIAYLKGECDAESGVWTISDFYFPKQKANGAHVDADDGEILADTIGSVHSHVGMGAFFSVEDKAHWNHPVELVINRKGETAACVRLQLQCGKFSRIETKIILIGDSDSHAWEAALEEKLREDKAIVSSSTTYTRSSHYMA